MKGFIYRLGIVIKEFGERVHIRLIANTGLVLRDKVISAGGKHERNKN